MKITLLTVGKTDVKWVREGLELYVSRLVHYIPFPLREIPELKNVSALGRDQVKAKVQRQKDKYGWEFLFLGANIDAVETAAHFGIEESRAVNYHCDPIGQNRVYEGVDRAVRSVRACAKVDIDWKKDIEEDFNTRKK